MSTVIELHSNSPLDNIYLHLDTAISTLEALPQNDGIKLSPDDPRQAVFNLKQMPRSSFNLHHVDQSLFGVIFVIETVVCICYSFHN